MGGHYVLGGPDGHTPRPVTLQEWAESFDREAHRVGFDELPGEIRVSTVFLGLDHQWGDGPPLLFETMIFGGLLDQYQERYSTWDEAVEGHRLALERARAEAE